MERNLIVIISDFLSKKKENDTFDVKRKYYDKNKKFDIIKDVAAFANNLLCVDKYIVFGVDEKCWDIYGININDIPEISSIEQYLHENIEPKVNIKIDLINIEGFNLAVLTICKENVDRPYIVKKSISNESGKEVLHKGAVYLRNGATNCLASRKELDDIYKAKECVCFEILRRATSNNLFTTLGGKRFIAFEVKINNSLDRQYDINSAFLRISLNDSTFLLKKCISTIENLSLKDKFYLDNEHSIQIPAYSTNIRWFNFVLEDTMASIIKDEIVKYEIIFNNYTDERTLEVN